MKSNESYTYPLWKHQEPSCGVEDLDETSRGSLVAFAFEREPSVL